MVTPMSQAASRAEIDSPKRRSILLAAGELFMTYGYGAVSMDNIARASGASKATLYAYFESKDVLFATIIGEACRLSLQTSDFLPATVDDLKTALSNVAGRMLRFLLEPGPMAIHRTVVAESARFPELGRAFYDNGPGMFRELFAEWLIRQQTAGRLDVPDAEMAADQFVGLLRGSTVFTRAFLGLDPAASEAEIGSTVAGTVSTFLRAFAVTDAAMATRAPARDTDSG